MITYSNLFYDRTVLVGVVMLIIFASLNIMILCLKSSKVEPSPNGQNPVQHANPNIGPDGKNKTIISGKNLLFAVAIISFVAIQFVAHILKINISIRLEVSFLIFQITPSLMLCYTFLNKYGVKGLDSLKEAFNI